MVIEYLKIKIPVNGYNFANLFEIVGIGLVEDFLF